MVKVIMILDQSGSMQNIRDNIRNSVNKFIDEQRDIAPEGKEDRFTLLKFSDVVVKPYTINNQLMADVKTLAVEDYIPSGGTALFDAIGLTITDFKNEEDVLMVIVTDGKNNASRTFKTRESIQELISKQKEEKNWTFLYLSTDIDTFEQGQGIGISGATDSRMESACQNIAIGSSSLGSYLSNQCSAAVGQYRQKKGKSGIALQK